MGINNFLKHWKVLLPPRSVLTCDRPVKGYDLRQKIGYCQPHDETLEDWLIVKYRSRDSNVSVGNGDWPACERGINFIEAP